MLLDYRSHQEARLLMESFTLVDNSCFSLPYCREQYTFSDYTRYYIISFIRKKDVVAKQKSVSSPQNRILKAIPIQVKSC